METKGLSEISLEEGAVLPVLEIEELGPSHPFETLPLIKISGLTSVNKMQPCLLIAIRRFHSTE